MLCLNIENFISFFVVMLLLWLDFRRNIPIAQEDLLVIQQQKSFSNWHKISFLLESTLPNVAQIRRNQGVETLHNIYWFSPLQKPAKICIICILNFNVGFCWLVYGESLVFQDLDLTLFLILFFFYFSFC